MSAEAAQPADPSRVANEDLRVDLCGPEDRAEQAELFNRCFKKHLGPEELAWRYDRGPHGPALSLVARPPGGRAICGYACSPRLVAADGGEPVPVGQTGDVMTDPEWRKRGIFTSLDRACMQEARRAGWPLTIGFPNRRSAHIFVKLGWESVGTIRPWRHYFGAGPRQRAARAREGRLRAALLPLALRACRRGRRSLAARSGGLSTRALEAFPAEVEGLARAVEPRFPFVVRRDPVYLTWRFLAAPSGLHRVIGVYDGSGAFVGYGVVQVPRQGGGGEAAVGYLVDVLGASDAAVAAAIGAGLDALEAAGAELVEATAIDGSWWSAELQRAGFLSPKPENHLIVIVHVHQPEHPLVRAARDASSWYFTDGDRDDETMG